jgi:hypothetical protein
MLAKPRLDKLIQRQESAKRAKRTTNSDSVSSSDRPKVGMCSLGPKPRL